METNTNSGLLRRNKVLRDALEKEELERDVYEEAFYALAEMLPDVDSRAILDEAREIVKLRNWRDDEEFARGILDAKRMMENG